MPVLKQSTAVEIPVGPFLDDTDGKTPETALVITQPDIRLKKNGAAWAQKNAAQTLTHEEAGWYEVALDATDTDTLGRLVIAIHESGALPVWLSFDVVTAAEYDRMFGSTLLAVNVTQWNGANVATPATAGYPAVTIKSGTGTGEVSLAAGLVTAGTVSDKTGYALSSAGVQAIWDALTSALTTANSIGKRIADNLDAAISSRLASGSYTAPLDAAGVRAAVGLGSANLDTQLDALPTVSELNARTLVAADYFNPATDAVTVGTNTDKTGYSLSASAVQAIWDALTSALSTANSIGKLLVDNINATISSRLASASYTAPLNAAGVRSAVGLASANLDTQLADIPTVAELAAADDAILAVLGTPAGASLAADIAAIEAQTDDIGAAGAGLTNVPWNAAWDAEVQSEVADALAAYDPPTRAEATSDANAIVAAVGTVGNYIDTEVAAIKTVTDNLATALEADGGVYRFTANALEQAPTGGGGGGLDAAGVRAAMGLAAANLDDQLADLPTLAELTARTLAAADYFNPTTDPVTVGTNNDKDGYGLADGAITTAKIANGAITAAKFAAGALDAVWSTATSGLTTVGSIGKHLVDRLDAAISSRMATFGYTAPANADIAAIKAKTDALTFTGTDVLATLDGEAVTAAVVSDKTGYALAVTPPTAAETATAVWTAFTSTIRNQIADHILRRSLASALASDDGDAKGFRSLLGAVSKLVNRVKVEGDVLTVYETNDTTVLGTQLVTASPDAEPITGVDTQ